MGVYVGDMLMPADVPNGARTVKGLWSHLTADSHEELMQAARALRLNPRWIQHPGTYKEHFDVTAGKRQEAIGKGIAEPLTMHEAGQKMLAAHTGAMDRQAGEAFKAGELDKAREILDRAQVLFPQEADLWESRLAQVEDKAPREVLGKAGMLPREKPEVEVSRPEPGSLPPVGIHREGGGQTTRGIFAESDRAPEPGPSHNCPTCSDEAERGDRTVTVGPKVEDRQEQCQACSLEASKDLSKVPPHPEQSPPTQYAKSCAKCGEAAPGPGGIICPPCKDEISQRQPVPVPDKEPGQ